MKNFINYIKESKQDEYEKLFLELAHLDELDIKFDFIEYKNYIFYFYNETELFDQYKKSRDFYINNNEIWSFFKTKYSLTYNDIQSITKDLVERHFKLKYITTFTSSGMMLNGVERHFKLKYITTKQFML